MDNNRKGKSDFRITLAAARVNAGYTQKEVASIMHKTEQTIVNWERGRSDIDYANFVFLCNLYKAPVDAVFMPKASTST